VIVGGVVTTIGVSQEQLTQRLPGSLWAVDHRQAWRARHAAVGTRIDHDLARTQRAALRITPAASPARLAESTGVVVSGRPPGAVSAGGRPESGEWWTWHKVTYRAYPVSVTVTRRAPQDSGSGSARASCPIMVSLSRASAT
jgi:hypothetical protein